MRKSITEATKIAAVTSLIEAQMKNEYVTRQEIADGFDISTSTLARSYTKYSDEVRKELEKAKEKIEAISEDNTSKAEIAREIYNEMMGSKRKDVLSRFMDEAKLTKAGASTYYYNIKKEFEQHKRN